MDTVAQIASLSFEFICKIYMQLQIKILKQQNNYDRIELFLITKKAKMNKSINRFSFHDSFRESRAQLQLSHNNVNANN